MTHTFEIEESDRQLIILALALMVLRNGPRPGFDFAAGNAAEQLGGRQMFEDMKRYNEAEVVIKPLPGDQVQP